VIVICSNIGGTLIRTIYRGRLVAIAVGLLLLAGCGGNGGETAAQQATPTQDTALAAQVPQEIKADGKLIFGTDASYPPNEFVDADGKTIIGWDIDFGKAVAAKLGLTPEFQNAGFDTIIPGVQSGKYEVGLSSLTDNKEREKVVDFVTYYSAGTAWAALKGNPKNVDPANACGLRVGVQLGTVQQEDLTARSNDCKQGGKPAINTVVRRLQTEVNADLVAGKTDAMLADSPIVGYAVKQTGDKLQIIGEVYDTAPYGLAVQKGGGLAQPLLEAVKAVMADGTYRQILEKWGVQDGAISEPVINGAQG
jgi:polar amino acid transport system substrate-binding protein